MMGPITDVTARIASIERRFAPPQPAFDTALRDAASSQGATATDAGSGPPVGGFSAASTRLQAPPALVGSWSSGLPPAGRAWAPSIERAALKAGVDPALMASLVWAESGFDPGVRSPAGAIGLAQLMPGTAASLGVDPHDPQQNLDGGARYLAEQLDRFGSPELALAAYNAGPSRVDAAGSIPAIAETQTYVPRVMAFYGQLRGSR